MKNTISVVNPIFLLAATMLATPLIVHAGINLGNGSYSYSNPIADYTNLVEPGLSLKRTYNSGNIDGSLPVPRGTFGKGGWIMPFLTEQIIVVRPYTTYTNVYGPYITYPAPSHKPVTSYKKQPTYSWTGYAIIYDADGYQLTLTQAKASGPWVSVDDPKAVVTCVSPSTLTTSPAPGPTDWGLYSSTQVSTVCGSYSIAWSDGRVQVFSSTNGSSTFNLTSFKSATGWSATLAYNSAGRLSTITSQGGRRLVFAYNSDGTISNITAPGGYVLNYSYDANGNLSGFDGPAGLGEKYLYQNSAAPTLLTQVNDLAGNMLEKVSYDSNLRGIRVEGPSGSRVSTVSYDLQGFAVYTSPEGVLQRYSSYAGSQSTYIYKSDDNFQNNVFSMGYYYDPTSGRLIYAFDYNGNQTSYAYNTAGTQVTTTLPNGLVTTATTDATRTRMLSYATATNKATYTYDSFGNVLTKKLTAGTLSQTWTYTYDSANHVTSVIDPATGKTTYAYNADGTLYNIINALGHTWTIGTSDPQGRPLTVTSPAGLVTNYTYDSVGRMLSRSIAGNLTTYAYTPHGNISRITGPDGSTINYSYNSADMLTGVADSNGARIDYTLDNAGRPLTAIQSNARGVVSSTSYNYETFTGGTASITDGLGNATTFSNDPVGNPISITDPLLRNTSLAYDKMNAIAAFTKPDSSSVQIGRDLFGNVSSIMTPDQQTTNYTINGLGQTTAQQSPDTGTTNFTYYPSGLPKTRTDARGKVTTYTYDTIGRVIGISYTGGPNIAYTYDTVQVGALTSIAGGGATLVLGYDGQGRVNSVKQTVGTVSQTIAYTYDGAGKLMSMITPSGQTVSLSYPVGASQPNMLSINGSPIISQFSWLPFTASPEGWVWANGVNHVRALNAAGRPSATLTDNVLSRKLTQDVAGDVIGVTDLLDATRSQSFLYDLNDRITGEQSASGRNYSYSYDSVGNRQTWNNLNNGTGQNYSYSGNLLNSVATTPTGSSATLSYDAAGNILSDGTRTFSYDGSGRLVSIKKGMVTTTYQYNGLGQRYSKTGVLFMHDLQGRLLGEYDITGKLIQETIWLGDLPIATLRRNGTSISAYYVQTDELGTSRAVTDTNNVPVWRWDSDAFGNGAANEDPGKTGSKFSYNLRFPGQYYDVESGLHHNGFRDYDPGLGRYIQSDPIGLAGGQFSTYGYASGNPNNLTDPLGLSMVDNIKNTVHDWPTTILTGHYVLGHGETLFLPESACPTFLNDPKIQDLLDSLKGRLDANGGKSFNLRTENYVKSIYAFGNGVDNIAVQCNDGTCDIRINREDAYTDPEDLHESYRVGKSPFSPEVNKHGTPFYFGLSCHMQYKPKCKNP